ncbi:MAG: DUF5343 domain-containing protein [Gemmatimonadales bacterium]|nr:DUF5343 domain-containing protein [Gemmatimonadales bacterium]
MALPDSYTNKPNSISAYFDAMLDAEAPDRFSVRFLVSLEFKSTNDRTFVGILKDLGFIDDDGVPKDRYFEFLDRSQSAKVVAVGVREAYAGLFAVNKKAQNLSIEEVKNKLRTLYKGAKKDALIGRIASTFTALCEYADFEALKPTAPPKKEKQEHAKAKIDESTEQTDTGPHQPEGMVPGLSVDALQYHINIVLPESRDQAVYDAIFKSLRSHLGRK